MLHWTRRVLVVAAALSLTGCLWGPGKFASDLTLRKNGTFVLDYRGEIVLQMPPDEMSRVEPWKPELAHCYDDGRVSNGPPIVLLPDQTDTSSGGTPKQPKERPCTASERAKAKADYERDAAERAAAKRKENDEMAKVFGLPGFDDASNRAFAAKLMKYEGWRSVAYRGNEVFDVVYHMEGRPTQDFLFPALPDNDFIIPFIAIRRRADGSVLVTAPAFTGGAGPIGARAGSAMAGDMKSGINSRAQGRFTVITDGEILTNNSEDGASPHPIGRQLHWDVGAASNKIPETLIRL